MSKKCKVCGEVVDCGVVLHRGCYDRLANGNQWVSTADRLPPSGELVLVVLNGEYQDALLRFKNAIELASCNDGDWIIEWLPNWENAQVTHWMRLPDLPVDLGKENADED